MEQVFKNVPEGKKYSALANSFIGFQVLSIDTRRVGKQLYLRIHCYQNSHSLCSDNLINGLVLSVSLPKE